MSNLLYPISVLMKERDNIHSLPKGLAAQLNEAIELLRDELKRRKEEREMIEKIEEREKEEEDKEEKAGVVDEHLFKNKVSMKDDIEKKFKEKRKNVKP